jgi:hypothetical protein
MTKGQAIRKIEWANRRCALRGEEFTEAQKEYLTLVFTGHSSENTDFISGVIESFQNFLTTDGQLEIEPEEAKRNVEIFVNSL